MWHCKDSDGALDDDDEVEGEVVVGDTFVGFVVAVVVTSDVEIVLDWSGADGDDDCDDDADGDDTVDKDASDGDDGADGEDDVDNDDNDDEDSNVDDDVGDEDNNEDDEAVSSVVDVVSADVSDDASPSVGVAKVASS